MSAGPLRVPVGPGLLFSFDAVPAPFRRRFEEFLAYFLRDRPSPCYPPIHIRAEPRPPPLPAGPVLLEEPPLAVRRAGGLTVFELPGILAWCDVAAARGGLAAEEPGGRGPDLFAGLALAPMLVELALSRGWLGVHAAGVAVGGAGILLPGPSGAGKSTIFADAQKAGLGVLSDDLVWIAPSADGPRMFAFPRGRPTAAVPWPSADGVAVTAIVCPEIAARGESRLSPLALPQAMAVLTGESGFLSAGAAAGERFRALVRLARSVPAYRLQAGPKRDDVPALLARVAAQT